MWLVYWFKYHLNITVSLMGGIYTCFINHTYNLDKAFLEAKNELKY
jgi:hypothetical protein